MANQKEIEEPFEKEQIGNWKQVNEVSPKKLCVHAQTGRLTVTTLEPRREVNFLNLTELTFAKTSGTGKKLDDEDLTIDKGYVHRKVAKK